MITHDFLSADTNYPLRILLQRDRVCLKVWIKGEISPGGPKIKAVTNQLFQRDYLDFMMSAG